MLYYCWFSANKKICGDRYPPPPSSDTCKECLVKQINKQAELTEDATKCEKCGKTLSVHTVTYYDDEIIMMECGCRDCNSDYRITWKPVERMRTRMGNVHFQKITGLGWNDQYPKSYVHKPSKEIEELKQRTEEYKNRYRLFEDWIEVAKGKDVAGIAAKWEPIPLWIAQWREMWEPYIKEWIEAHQAKATLVKWYEEHYLEMGIVARREFKKVMGEDLHE